MNKVEIQFVSQSVSNETKLQPVEWFDDASFTVEVKHEAGDPVTRPNAEKQHHVKLDFGIFSCRSAFGLARFWRRRWYSRVGS